MDFTDQQYTSMVMMGKVAFLFSLFCSCIFATSAEFSPPANVPCCRRQRYVLKKPLCVFTCLLHICSRISHWIQFLMSSVSTTTWPHRIRTSSTALASTVVAGDELCPLPSPGLCFFFQGLSLESTGCRSIDVDTR